MADDVCREVICCRDRIAALQTDRETLKSLYDRCLKNNDECSVFNDRLTELDSEILRCQNVENKRNEECKTLLTK
jgi:hypothetical protein